MLPGAKSRRNKNQTIIKLKDSRWIKAFIDIYLLISLNGKLHGNDD